MAGIRSRSGKPSDGSFAQRETSPHSMIYPTIADSIYIILLIVLTSVYRRSLLPLKVKAQSRARSVSHDGQSQLPLSPYLHPPHPPHPPQDRQPPTSDTIGQENSNANERGCNRDESSLNGIERDTTFEEHRAELYASVPAVTPQYLTEVRTGPRNLELQHHNISSSYPPVEKRFINGAFGGKGSESVELTHRTDSASVGEHGQPGVSRLYSVRGQGRCGRAGSQRTGKPSTSAGD